MTLSRLLKLQWIYIILGVGYNIVSYFVVMSGGQQLSTTMPLKGGPAMLLYGVFLLAAYTDRIILYRILMTVAVFFYGWGGIVVHLINYSQDPSLYASFAAWIIAVGINVYGLGLSLVAITGKFENDRLSTTG
ncbi:hypothetical protein KJ966_05870 [bacterium]|nr:hypothetical protein [bacterium]